MNGASRWYRRLITVLFSADVVARHGDEMEATFVHMLDGERRERGRFGAAAAWLRAVSDGIRSGRVGSAVSAFTTGLRRVPGLRSGFAISWLDAKLGIRMLGKNPGLTVVALFALAVGIPVGLAPWHLFRAMEAPLPVEEGDRIRYVRHWSIETSRTDSTTLYDYQQWEGQLRSFERMGAFRRGTFNVGVTVESAAPAAGTEVTASSFDILRVAPLHGRTLVAADEIVGAPNVAVLGHEIWQARFGGNPAIVGSTVHVAHVPHTVVGIMPMGFRFPVADQLWLPLRERPADEPFAGRSLNVFGRLAAEATGESAEAELATLRSAQAAEFPAAYGRLQTEVVPFAFMALGFPKAGILAMPEFYFGQVFTLILLGIACANVAMLMFARAATRTAEFAVRTALGASRARVVSQMFTESLVLAVMAAAVGLVAIDRIIDPLLGLVIGDLPYWVDMRITWSTAALAISLAVGSAAIAGVIPALRVTGKAPQRDMQRAAQGAGGFRFGNVSSFLIVADVAVAVAVVGLAVILTGVVRDAWMTEYGVGIEAEEFLAAEVRLSSPELRGDERSDAAQFRAHVDSTLRELRERLEAEPGVRAVVIAQSLPRMDHRIRRVDVEGDEVVEDFDGYRVRTVAVDIDFFRDLDRDVAMGRDFDTRDLAGDRTSVIVNTSFVANVLDGRDPIGHRFRYRNGDGRESGPWYQIVGVVSHLGMHVLAPDEDEGVYHPVSLGELQPAQIGVHVSDDPALFAPRLRALAAQVDPLAVVASTVVLADVFEGDWYFLAAIAGGVMLFVAILLTLAASGLYAIMSLTVSQRTREIGIRTALGARRVDVVVAIARRALLQLALGVAIGMPIAGRLFYEQYPESTYGAILTALAPGIVVMVVVGVLACGVPTLRALRVAPTEALR